MVVLIDFAIPVIIGELLRVILITPLEKLYTRYFNFEILTSNGLQKTRNRVKVWEIKIEKDFLVL